MSNYWGEIRRFFQREKIKFKADKGHYDSYYGRYHYQVTIDDPASVSKFKEFQKKGYFGAMHLCNFKIVESGQEPQWF